MAASNEEGETQPDVPCLGLSQEQQDAMLIVDNAKVGIIITHHHH